VNLQTIEAAIARLPERCEPLLLTFYRAPLEVVGRAVVVGTDEGTQIRVDLADGRVFSVDPEGDLPTRLVNSSVEQLADAIAAYREYAARVRDVDDDAAARLVEELRRRLEAIDGGATSGPSGWWSLILEQAEHGLL
jgi:hypothetical protein